MGPLIQHLMDEHKVVVEKVQQIQNISRSLTSNERLKPDLLPLIQDAKTFINGIHHRKEEEVLFPAIAESKKLREGGPHCTYFMGLKLVNDPAEKLLNLGREQGVPTSEHPSHIAQYRDSKNPLMIPIEEHDAGHTALTMVLDEINSVDPSLKKVQTLVDHYADLIRLHSQKEDRCLFVMADEVLDDELQTKLLKKALEIAQKL